MKQFLKRFCLFLLPVIATYALLELKLGSLPNTYSQKRADFETQLGDIQVLVLGPGFGFGAISFFS
jgi:hypothetical protein